MNRKKTLNLVLMLCVLLISGCGSTVGYAPNTGSKTKNTAATNSQLERIIKGTWSVEEYKVDGINEDYVSLDGIFGVASLSCFKGSTWSFIPNNATGSYSLNGTGKCQGTHNIKWRIVEKNTGEYFEFKHRYDGLKDKFTEIGYAMEVLSVSESNMTLKQEIPFEGKKIAVIYEFLKIN